MSIIGIIPARAGSVGIKGKNIKQLYGKPLIAWTIQCALKSGLSRVIVSTESEEIAAVARQFGAEVPFIRPTNLASDTAAIEPVILHALDWLIGNENYQCDGIALLFPTHPLRTVEHINLCIDAFCNTHCDSVVSVDSATANDNPYWMLKKNNRGEVRLFTDEPLSEIKVRRQDLPVVYKRNDLVYILKEKNIRQKKPDLYGSEVELVETPYCFDIDLNTGKDWKLLESVFHMLIEEEMPS